MDRFPSDQIRNVAVAGHDGSGKTSLVEALLAHAGAVARPGRVEDGTTVSDHDPEEVARHQSINLSVAPCVVDAGPAGPIKLNLIDTPGVADFDHEVEVALSVADLVVVVVSAVDGVQVRTEAVWRAAADAGLARMIFVNKLDRERADFDRVLADVRERFGAGIAPLELPLGAEAEFRGVLDLLADTAIEYPSGTTSGTPGPVPDDLAATEHEVHEALVEGIVVGDDELMERYLEGDTLSFEELEASLAGGVAEAAVFPLVCGSATAGIGIDRLALALADLCPPPTRRRPALVTADGDAREIPCHPDGPTIVQVFSTMTDPYAGKRSLCRVVSGTVRPDTVLTNSRTRTDERLHALEMLRGASTEPVGEAAAGDVFVVAKLAGTATGDTLVPKGEPLLLESPAYPAPEPPAFSVAITPRSKADEDKLMTAVHRLIEEDPALSVTRVDETHQTVLGGTGDTHIAVALARLEHKYGVGVEREEVAIPYRETITREATAEGRYKKQTGGHGQFGVATLRIAPLGRGEGFRFDDEVVGGVIPRQFIPAVEKGVVESMSQGGAFGFPVVDVAVACVDGKHHPVDSSEMSFKMAGSLAFRESLARADPVLLEPVSRLEVTVPATLQGDVLGDLNARRGRVQGTDIDERGDQTITALVPTAELGRYAIDLRALTGGRARFRATHDHYDTVPAHLADKIARLPEAAAAGH